MALAFTALAAASAATTNQATAYAGTAGTPVANDLLICFVQCTGNTTVGTLSGTWTWTLLTSYTTNAGADISSIWYAQATAATSTTPSYLPTSNASGCVISCVRVTGGEGRAQPYIRQTAKGTGTTANPTAVFPSVPLTGNGILAFAQNLTNSATQWTVPTSFTEISEVAYNAPTVSVETASRASGQTTATLTWTNANTTAWVTYAMEFYLAGTGPIIIDSIDTGFFGGISSI